MLEYVRLVRPEIFTIPRQLSGPSDHLFMNYRLGGQPHRNLEQPCGPLERPYRSEEQLCQPEEQAYRPGDQLNRSQNDSGTHGAGTHGAGMHVLDWFNF
ncbi:hypothetical protein MKW94_017255 [Papaver nudicaule]|uniref:Uncharacterized protein n=1 Tax=Papaver nudicaule TaxID=74823 RepID=A0AA41V6I9_PAPNU|nr:hypothetical protein [Papaver nudicaule]